MAKGFALTSESVTKLRRDHQRLTYELGLLRDVPRRGMSDYPHDTYMGMSDEDGIPPRGHPMGTADPEFGVGKGRLVRLIADVNGFDVKPVSNRLDTFRNPTDEWVLPDTVFAIQTDNYGTQWALPVIPVKKLIRFKLAFDMPYTATDQSAEVTFQYGEGDDNPWTTDGVLVLNTPTQKAGVGMFRGITGDVGLGYLNLLGPLRSTYVVLALPNPDQILADALMGF